MGGGGRGCPSPGEGGREGAGEGSGVRARDPPDPPGRRRRSACPRGRRSARARRRGAPPEAPAPGPAGGGFRARRCGGYGSPGPSGAGLRRRRRTRGFSWSDPLRLSRVVQMLDLKCFGLDMVAWRLCCGTISESISRARLLTGSAEPAKGFDLKIFHGFGRDSGSDSSMITRLRQRYPAALAFILTLLWGFASFAAGPLRADEVIAGNCLDTVSGSSQNCTANDG